MLIQATANRKIRLSLYINNAHLRSKADFSEQERFEKKKDQYLVSNIRQIFSIIGVNHMDRDDYIVNGGSMLK